MGGGGISGGPFWAPPRAPPGDPKIMETAKIIKITRNHEIPWNSWILLKFTGISWNTMKITTFWWNGGLCVTMVENVDIPKGFLVVLEVPWTPKRGNHKNPGFNGKLHEFSDFPLFYMKMLEICDFRILGCRGPPKPPIILEDHWWFQPWGRKGNHFTKRIGI